MACDCDSGPRMTASCSRCRKTAAMLRQAATDAEALATLRQLVVDLQQHSREAGWQDVDDPIAALLALALTGDATEGQG